MYTSHAASVEQADKLIIGEPNATGLNTPGTYEVASLHKFAGGKKKSKAKYGGKTKKYNTRKLKRNNRFTRSKRFRYHYKK